MGVWYKPTLRKKSKKHLKVKGDGTNYTLFRAKCHVCHYASDRAFVIDKGKIQYQGSIEGNLGRRHPDCEIVHRSANRWIAFLKLMFILAIIFFPKGIVGTIRDMINRQKVSVAEYTLKERVKADILGHQSSTKGA